MKQALFIFLMSCWAWTNLPGQTELPQGIYLILDASGSMWGKLADNSYKIETAKKVLLEFVGGDFEGRELAIRVYGHRQKGDCRDSELLIPFGSPDKVAAQLAGKIKTIKPVGRTPITYSFKEALTDFGDRPGRIILISDGIETCDEDPCALMKIWKEKNVAIKVHVVGFGVEEKEKLALACISEVAETEFNDAKSAEDLIESLKKVEKEIPKPVFAALNIKGFDKEGDIHRIEAELFQNGKKVQEVNSEGNHQVAAGEYTIRAGVRTRNGNLYAPVEKKIRVAEVGRTKVDFDIVVPPRLKTVFLDDGNKVRGGTVYVYQNSKELFHFRWMDEIYIDEGAYEIRSEVDRVNKVSKHITIQAGERKEVPFNLKKIIRVYVRMYASESKTVFRKNLELYQDGTLVTTAHSGNGAKIQPGTYDVIMRDDLGDWEEKGVELTEEDKNYELLVPCGHVEFEYQKKDGTKDKDDRMWLGREGVKRTRYVTSGKVIPVLPGTYRIEGWSAKGEYEPKTFKVEAGEEKKISLRAK